MVVLRKISKQPVCYLEILVSMVGGEVLASRTEELVCVESTERILHVSGWTLSNCRITICISVRSENREQRLI